MHHNLKQQPLGPDWRRDLLLRHAGQVLTPPDVLVAAGVIVRDPQTNHVLLQLRGDDATWGLPGGRIEPGETLEAAARRELLEETGLIAGQLTQIDVYSGPEFVVRYPGGYSAFVVGATFETQEFTGELTNDEAGETVELAWFASDALPRNVNSYNRLVLERAGLLLQHL